MIKDSESQKPSLKNIGVTRRKAVGVSQEAWIRVGRLPSGEALPLVLQPAIEGVDLVEWAKGNRGIIEGYLLKHGGILFRGFNISSAADFEQFSTAFSTALLEYTYRSTPRSQERGNIYTSTEYPADQVIPLHNENAYTSTWPMKIWFFCVTAARQGGETPIADSRKVFARIDPKIREHFMQKKVRYVRNYRSGIDLPWQAVFQTTSKSAVEEYCRSAGIGFEWKNSDHLRTSQVCRAVASHPQTGEMVWFNQAHLFHVSSLPAEARETLLSTCQEEDLPRNAYYGDGSPIELAVLDEIRAIYQQEAVLFPWQEGDILMLDNMLIAHGRSSFVGPRKILVSMAEACSNKDM
jgi:alpha-ketoglutarate-dependent taurine dioxygenase